jgi:hypothetical protein
MKNLAGQHAQVIIIGAPRSGTNILRDVLTNIPGITTWPCDEINYIWRHGNLRYPSDEIPAELMQPKIAAYIQNRFKDIAKKYRSPIVIEKTCANSLRVPYVYKACPDAKFIYIHRNGIDAAASAKLRWVSKMDIPYILRKARYVPLLDMPYYAFKYLWSRVYRTFSRESRLAFWGPKLSNNSEILKKYDVLEVCALQWQQCVESAEDSLAKIPSHQVRSISYEEFVEKPTAVISDLLRFIEHSVSAEIVVAATKPVRGDSLGKAKKQLQTDEIDSLNGLIGGTLNRRLPQHE